MKDASEVGRSVDRLPGWGWDWAQARPYLILQSGVMYDDICLADADGRAVCCICEERPSRVTVSATSTGQASAGSPHCLMCALMHAEEWQIDLVQTGALHELHLAARGQDIRTTPW